MKLEIKTIREITKEPAIVHCSSIVQTNDKDFWCVWYECPYETSMETVIKISRKGQNDAKWGPDETLFDFHGMGLGNPVIWTMDGKEIHIVFSALLEESWAKGQIFYSSTTDRGKTWTPPTLFVHQIGFMAKTRPIINKKNQILFPLYHEGEICPYVLVYDDWKSPLAGKLIAETMARTKAIQPTLLHLEQSTYLMLSRTNQGCIYKSLSYNNGLSWSICTPTKLPNPNSALDLVRLPSGEVLLVYNPSSVNRNHLTVALSKDNTQSWFAMRDIVHGDGEYSYPSAILDDKGRIHVSYTENRYIIKHAAFDKEWLLEKELSEPMPTE